MAKSTAASNSLLALMYNATAWANVADNAASSPLANTYIALHVGPVSAGGDTDQTAGNRTIRARLARDSDSCSGIIR